MPGSTGAGKFFLFVGETMADSSRFKKESLALLLSVLSGAAIAALLASKDSFFLGNFAFYWLPQAAVLAVLMFFVSRPAVFFGVAIVLAIYLGFLGSGCYLCRSRSQWHGLVTCFHCPALEWVP